MPLSPEQEKTLQGVIGRVQPGQPMAADDEKLVQSITNAPDLEAGMKDAIKQGILRKMQGAMRPETAPGVAPTPTAPGMAATAATAPLQAAGAVGEAVGEPVVKEMQEKGTALGAATIAAKAGTAALLGSNRVARNLIERSTAATAGALGSKFVRYLLTPFLTGTVAPVIEAGGRLVAGQPQQTGGEMTQEMLANALAQYPAAFLQARSLRNDELTSLGRRLAQLDRGEGPVGGALTRERQQVQLGKATEAGKAETAMQTITGEAATALPDIDQLGRDTVKQIVKRQGRMENTKNALYGNGLQLSRKLVSEGSGPSIAQNARETLAILKQASSAQTAITQGPAQLAETGAPLQESIDQIMKEASTLTDVPVPTLDRWRAMLSDHVQTGFAPSAKSGSYTKGTINRLAANIREAIDVAIKGTPAEAAYKKADDFFAREVLRIRDLKNKLVSEAHPGAIIEAFRETARTGTKGEQLQYMLRNLDPDTVRQLRAQHAEQWLAHSTGADGTIDADTLLKDVNAMLANPSTGARDMAIRFGAPGSQVRDAVEALRSAQAYRRVTDPPFALKKAIDAVEREKAGLTGQSEALTEQNARNVQRAFTGVKAGAYAKLTFEALNALRTGDFRMAFGSLLHDGGAIGAAVVARAFSDKNAIKTLGRMNRIADFMASHQTAARIGTTSITNTKAGKELVRLGSSLVAHMIAPDFSRSAAVDDANNYATVPGPTSGGVNVEPEGGPPQGPQAVAVPAQ